MNKHIFLMGMAAAMLMTGCANEEDFVGGSNTQGANSDVPIMLSAGQQANKTRATIGNVDGAGKYDGTFDTPEGKNLGFYCLATGKISAKQDINWRTGFDNPNVLWMENVQAKAKTTLDDDLSKKVTNIEFLDAAGTTAANYFYPMGSQYSYTFYGYYPYSSNDNITHNGNKYSLKVTGLDGATDLIWGKSFVAGDDSAKKYAYSAKYLREKKSQLLAAGKEWNDAARKNVRPQVTFVHKLMKFNIILRKGTGENTDIENLGIKSAKLLNVADGGTLVIANLDGLLGNLNEDMSGKEGEFIVDWSTARNHATDATAFKLRDKDGKIVGEEVTGPCLGTEVQQVIGDGFLVPVPKLLEENAEDGSRKYVDNGYVGTDASQLANKGIFRLRIDYYMKDNPDVVYKAAQYEITPTFKNTTSGLVVDEPWQPGYEYDIVISVSDPELIKTTGYLTPWEKRIIELE